MTTLDNARELARQLNTPEKAQLMSELAQDLVLAEADTIHAQPGDPRALLAAVQQVGPWEGDDLEEVRELAYATRSQVGGYWSEGDWHDHHND
jgi:hypothetical protein